MNRILLITTGGTISSVESLNGLTPDIKGSKLLSFINTKYQVDIIDLEHIDSSIMSNEYRINIANIIWKNKNNYLGFVITHGTDTLAYTAAFLEASLENFNKPIILTGSQKPITFENTDAVLNLTKSFDLVSSGYSGVYIVSWDNIIPAKVCTKISTENFNAFTQLYPYIKINGTELFHSLYTENIGHITIMPNLSSKFIENYNSFYAIIVDCFGSGGMMEHQLETLSKLSENGIDIYLRSACQNGNIDKIYAAHQSVDKFYNLNGYSLEYSLAYLMFKYAKDTD